MRDVMTCEQHAAVIWECETALPEVLAQKVFHVLLHPGPMASSGVIS